MAEYLGVRVPEYEFGLFMRMKEELGVNSSALFRIAVLNMGAKETRFTKEVRELSRQLQAKYKSEIQREVTKYELRKMMAVNNQLLLIKKLKAQGIPEANLKKFRAVLNAELKELGIDYTHKNEKDMKVRK